jgi:hypothetical protein
MRATKRSVVCCCDRPDGRHYLGGAPGVGASRDYDAARACAGQEVEQIKGLP